MIKKKIIQDNTDSNAPAKNRNWEEYLNTTTMKMQPASAGFKDRLFLGLVIYVTENEECYDIEEYIDLQGVNISTYHEWKKQKPEYKQAHEKAKRIIGRRLEKIGVKRNLGINSATIFMLPHYSEKWKEQIEWRSKLKEKEENDGKTKFIVVEDHMWCKNKEDCDSHQNHKFQTDEERKKYIEEKMKAENDRG